MRTASKTYIVTLIAASSLILGACSHYSDDLASLDQSMKAKPQQFAMAPQDIAPAAGAVGSPSASLNEYLARDYYELARYENDKAFDYKASKGYTQKAIMASKGERVQPSVVSAYDIPSERIDALKKAREHLMAALQSPQQDQQALAKAQTGFDCWLERAEEADVKSHYAECKAQFEQSMLNLTAPAAGEATTTAGATTVYQIGFMQTSAVPDEASRKRIDYIAQTLIAPENASMGIALSAAPGEVGTARLNSIRQALINKGVAATRITQAPQAAVPATAPATEAVNEGVQATIIGATTSSTTTTTSKYVPVTPTTIPSPEPIMEPVTITPSAGN